MTRTSADPLAGRATPAHRVWPPLGVLAAAAAAVALVGVVDPHEPGHYPVCPLFRATGISCFACGGLRAVHALAHGDPAAAFGDNALVPLALAGGAALWTAWLVNAVRGRETEVRFRPLYAWLLGAVALSFMIVRNLPFGAGLAP
ncbi:hypothetical protein AQ490_03040 [Wenjunlia vitaminophila]|uniref:DUF2752 domain-containing protein n=1 Tax=Wenjunlia vitaminophila TaxID=76728 RepID=A0A0T6LTN8_WENVI|nr:DUF2752 domain-containing protein [Wenjunlia vitaminophila]KRV49202.1 hypothetical protein AQ490_03040 [Wenjunlia vitaminophila]